MKTNKNKLIELLENYCECLWEIYYGKNEIQKNKLQEDIIKFLNITDKNKISEIHTILKNFPIQTDGYNWIYDIKKTINLINLIVTSKKIKNYVIKEKNGYWIDDNGNKWSMLANTQKEALTQSKKLINCKNCIDCWNCTNCNNCNDCGWCLNCLNCISCNNCINCNYCTKCSWCDKNYKCIDCHNCCNCNYCNHKSRINNCRKK